MTTGASSHSLKYFHSSISEPSRRLPHFVSLGYMDDQLFSYYDSNSRKFQPRVPWIEKVRKEDPQYWEGRTQTCRGKEESFIEHLEILRTLYNHSVERRGQEAKWGGGSWREAQGHFQDPPNLVGGGRKRKKTPFGDLPE
ncbi:major histocompatibility complex class I-related protein-like [Crotalus adamanteus]|uniref:Major histocompatibility complex class I-related protein-like n=1 Tax=Crotalus adamanteus TaxID=8729 RepID=A0AAW1BTE5_CROAD